MKPELLVIMAPDKFDRNTEYHFKPLFDTTKYVLPPSMLSKGEENPKPRANSVLLFEGGTDISPHLYNEKVGSQTEPSDTARDDHEYDYAIQAAMVDAPMIGICRGAQLLCAMSGGGIIQHVTGHNEKTGHPMRLPEELGGRLIAINSAHHQMMNPYTLPADQWKSFGFSNTDRSSKYLGGNNQKIKPRKKWGDSWREQEIVWFPKTKCLCIQGHPEWINDRMNSFVRYCQYLTVRLILNPMESNGTGEDEISSD